MPEAYGELRPRRELRGRPIGAEDLLIAARALAADPTVGTDEVRQLRRVEGLRVES